MKISIPILRDSYNSYPSTDLEITGDGSEVTLCIGTTSVDREIAVSARDLARALRAFVDDEEPLPDADGWIRHVPGAPIPEAYAVRFKDGDVHYQNFRSYPDHWDHTSEPDCHITHYKLHP